MNVSLPYTVGDTLTSANAPDLAWVPWTAEGTYFKLLNADPDAGRYTLLLRVEPKAELTVLRHIDPAEAYVLEGSFYYEDDPDTVHAAGAYVCENAGAMHKPVSDDGAVLFAVFHGPIERFGRDGALLGTFDWRWHVHAWNAAGGHYPI